MANGVGVGLVLHRLSGFGCDPQRSADGTWIAQCPVHGGPYRALLVDCHADGSATVKCRYVNHKGESCTEAEIWQSLGLEPQQFERTLATNPQRNGTMEGEAREPVAAGGGEQRPVEPEPARDGENMSPADQGDAQRDAELAKVDTPPTRQAPEIATVPCLATDHGSVGTSPEGRRSHIQARRGGGSAAEANPSRATRPGRARARLLRRLLREVRLIRGVDDRFYAQVAVADHCEVHELGSAWFKYWLIRVYRQRHRTVPARDYLSMVIHALEAEAAALETPEAVWARVADGTWGGGSGSASASHVEPNGHAGGGLAKGSEPEFVYYLDLGDSSWQCVEIRPEGCRLIEHAPVFFRRPRGMRALPAPQWDGSIDLLKKYTNVPDQDFPLFLAWMAAALRPAGPYPILVLTGEQGSAKSTMARVVRRLIDPSAAILKGPPSSQQDFMIQAHNSWVLPYDNLSSLSAALADAFCRTSTGGGYSTRALYSNDSETLFDVERPVIITGIGDFVERSDLIDRCVTLRLAAIPDEARRREQEFWSDFRADWPRLMGALLKAVAGGLKMLTEVDLAASPRMADFAQWGEAVVRGLGWRPGSFLDRYHDNRRAACDSALDDNEVAQALRGMIGSAGGPWRGTASELLQLLVGHARRGGTKTAQWPKTPQLLSGALRRILPQLRTTGIIVNFERIDNTRTITISQPLSSPELDRDSS